MIDSFDNDEKIEVFSARKKLDGCYGAFQIEVSDSEIKKKKKGKVLYFTIQGGEYAIALTSKEKNIKVNFKYE